jgi:hypothetical protein
MRYRSLVRNEKGIEPVTLPEAKLHLRIDSSDDDDLISALITTARRWAEDYCDRTFVVSQYTLSLDSFYGAIGSPVQFGLKADGNNIEGRQGTVPQLDIELPRPPMSPLDADGQDSPVVITYTPTAGGARTTLASTEYRVDYDATPGVARPLYGKTWPSHLVDQNSVTVKYYAGPTAYWNEGVGLRNGTINMAAVQAAIKMVVGHLWSNRDASTETALSEVPFGVKAMLDTLRWGSYR